MTALRLEAPRIAYAAGTPVLGGVSLAFAPGEATAVLGGNGAGKSALLWALAGLLPTQGAREVLGLPARSVTQAVEAGLGLVLQDPDDQLLGPTLADDVAFGPRNQCLAPLEVERRQRRALAAVGIEHLAARPVTALSYGEKKRGALAAALAMEPRVLLLDEPTAGLDPRAELAMARTLAELAAGGVTLVVATHAVDVVPLYATRVMVLSGGRVAFDGPVREAFRDEERLVSAGLRRPFVTELHLRRGGSLATMPLTVEEAAHA